MKVNLHLCITVAVPSASDSQETTAETATLMGMYSHYYSTFQVGCLREIGSNGEMGIRSIDVNN